MHRPDAERRLSFLHEVGVLLQRSTDLDQILGPVLRLLSERLGLERAGLCVWDRRREEVALVAAHGLTPAEVQRGRWAPGQGVVGRVVETGRAERVLPGARLAGERVGDRDPLDPRAFLVVPVRTEDGVLGALGAYRDGVAEASLDDDERVLVLLAGLLVPATRRAIQRSAEQAAELQPASLIGRSKPMRVVYEAVGQVARSPATVLLRGESGTGKELVASAVHQGSDRAHRPFVKVNIAALPDSLVESELFGHERGAFTGAAQRRKGRFELAHGGTLFLDEIGDLSPASQVKLLRVLQEGELQRVGGNETITVDVRIVAATSRDLEHMVESGAFRADLYYRLNVFPIRLPALRERRSDVLLLADHFVEQCSRSHGRDVRRISTSAIDMLMAYHWPGNVRELENCIERAVLLARDGVILGHHLPPTLQTGEASGTVAAPGGLQARLDALEREVVLDAVKEARGNLAEAARVLGISERIMGLRAKKYGVDWRQYRLWDGSAPGARS
ncbi:MAG: sigma 54-interacting transcriptional regulator [Myxococcota bacterium]